MFFAKGKLFIKGSTSTDSEFKFNKKFEILDRNIQNFSQESINKAKLQYGFGV